MSVRNLPVAIISLPGLLLFLWPFFGANLPASTPAWALMLAAVGALFLVEAGTRQLDSRGVALLAAIAAIDTVLRLAVIEGIGGFSPIYFLVLCAGYVFGSTYGFLVGALSILVSATVGGGVGPWVPYQVFAVGWVGAVAGLAGRRRSRLPGWQDLAVLALVGAVMGWVVGALLDIQDWVTVYRGNPTLGWEPGLSVATAVAHVGRFYLVTSLAYDTFRAVGNVIMVLLLGAPVLAALSRLQARLTFEVVKQT
ncbi:MAG TPA: ECF transporter S component [Candidatus Dormibacteraeota bacterium]|nr:ECF transporter S component [Candidatus Dormibacteraeota bacterium]